jgi:hypothetical protein
MPKRQHRTGEGLAKVKTQLAKEENLKAKLELNRKDE